MDSYLLTYLRSQNIKVAKTVKIKKSAALLLGRWGFYLREVLFGVITVFFLFSFQFFQSYVAT